MLCDSNILIYAADPADAHCAAYVERDDACISVVSRIEVLGFPGYGAMTQDRRDRLVAVVTSLIELHLDEPVIQRAIALRQQRKMSLGDCIIAATALIHGVPLVTRNTDDFKHLAGLTVINPFATT